MKVPTHHSIRLGGRLLEYRVVSSRSARRLRVRVGLSGIEVLQPLSRSEPDVGAFLRENETWLLSQLARVSRIRRVRRPVRQRAGVVLFRGELTQVRIANASGRPLGNAVRFTEGEIVVHLGSGQTPVEQSLESWLRRQARLAIERHLTDITARLGHFPNRVYVMGQRTKWGACSRRRNLSFNWRLILAPEPVLKYLVTHEAVHLAVPDHSAKFWLTVQSLCPESERSRLWLVANGHRITVDMKQVVSSK